MNAVRINYLKVSLKRTVSETTSSAWGTPRRMAHFKNPRLKGEGSYKHESVVTYDPIDHRQSSIWLLYVRPLLLYLVRQVLIQTYLV